MQARKKRRAFAVMKKRSKPSDGVGSKGRKRGQASSHGGQAGSVWLALSLAASVVVWR